MATQTVTLVLDAQQYYAEIAKITRANQGLNRSGQGIGEGFLRGDRAIRVATANIAQGLLTATTAADAALIAFQSLERVFKIPLLSTVAASATIVGIATWRKALLEVEDARSKLQRQLATPLKVQVDLSPEDIAARINSLSAATEEFTRKSEGWAIKLQKFFAGPLLTTSGAIESSNRAAIAEGEQRLSQLSGARADKELQIANAKRAQLGLDKEEIEVQEAGLKLSSIRAQLIDEFISKGGIVIDFYKRLAAAQIDVATVIEKSMTKLAEKSQTLAQDIGSGKFLKDLQQTQTDRGNQQAGTSQLAQFRADRANGIPLGPNALAMLAADDANRAEAERLNPTQHPGRLAGIGESQDLVDQIEQNRLAFEGLQRGMTGEDGGNVNNSGAGIGDTADDFIRMSEGLQSVNQQLQDLDFRGLLPLSGLTITIE